MNFLPIKVAYAAAAVPLLDNIVKNVLNPIVGLLVGVGIIIFMYGVLEFLSYGDNMAKNEEGKKHMLWGIVGIFIMVSVNGIMRLICNTVGSSC